MKRVAHNQRGQIFVITAICMFAMLAMAAFVIDVGVAFRQHRHAQAAADASALAAAQLLPGSTTLAGQASTAVANKNFTDGTISLSYSTTYVANDTVTANGATSSPTFFAKIFGKNKIGETATATARVGSYTGWSQGMAPWVTDQASLKWGQILTFKVKPGDQASSGNFGGADLKIKQKGCQSGSGGSDYRNLIGGSFTACEVDVGGQIGPETGNLNGPTSQGLQDRGVIQNFNPYSILTQQPDGTYVLNTYTHPNLVVIPVISQFYGGTSKPLDVIGFAWFIITSYTNTTVTGMFIGSEAPNGAQCTTSGATQGCPIGGYSDLGFKVIELVN